MEICKECGREAMLAPLDKGLCFPCRSKDRLPMPRCKPPKGQKEPDLRCAECGIVFENKDFEERKLQESQNIPFLCKPCYDKLKNIDRGGGYIYNGMFVPENAQEAGEMLQEEKETTTTPALQKSVITGCDHCDHLWFKYDEKDKICPACGKDHRKKNEEEPEEKEVYARTCYSCAAYSVCRAFSKIGKLLTSATISDVILWADITERRSGNDIARSQALCNDVYRVFYHHCLSQISQPVAEPVITKGE